MELNVNKKGNSILFEKFTTILIIFVFHIVSLNRGTVPMPLGFPPSQNVYLLIRSLSAKHISQVGASYSANEETEAW